MYGSKYKPITLLVRYRLPATIAMLAALATTAQAQPVLPVQVGEGVWMVQGASALGSPANRNFISNAAFVVTGEGVVVTFDARGLRGL